MKHYTFKEIKDKINSLNIPDEYFVYILDDDKQNIDEPYFIFSKDDVFKDEVENE